MRWQAPCDIDHLARKKRITRFNAVGEGHPITMIAEQMIGQPEFQIRIGSPLQRVETAQLVQ